MRLLTPTFWAMAFHWVVPSLVRLNFTSQVPLVELTVADASERAWPVTSAGPRSRRAVTLPLGSFSGRITLFAGSSCSGGVVELGSGVPSGSGVVVDGSTGVVVAGRISWTGRK